MILEAHEEFIGLYQVGSTDASSLFAVIYDVLLRLNISITKIRGQCYDGASSMAGTRSGVATWIMEEPKALYTNCYGHALSLAYSDCYEVQTDEKCSRYGIRNYKTNQEVTSS